MSDTKRKIPGFVFKTNLKLDSNFINRMEYGLIPMSKPQFNKSGNYGIDEVWGQDGKKFSKRLRNRSLRRQNKKIEE